MARNKLKTLIILLTIAVSTILGQMWDCGATTNADGAASVKAILDKGVLTIRGSGAMADYYYGGAPWADYPYQTITKVVIENGVTTIGDNAFSGCYGLTEVTIPNSVTSIGSEAFYFCHRLGSITIPESVTSIGSYAFSGCYGLTGTLTIPNSVTSIGEKAFYNCLGLISINVGSQNTAYSSQDGVLFNKDKTTLIQYPISKQGAYTVPNSVTSIKRSAFYGCSGLTSVTIPNSVTSIGSYAFGSCDMLTEVANLAATPQSIVTDTDADVFSGLIIEYIVLYVPQKSIDAYKAADDWKDFNVMSVCEKLDHFLGDWTTIAPATCLVSGLEYKECSRCDHEITQTIAMSEHLLSDWTVSEHPTCTTPGYSVIACTIVDCDHIENSKTHEELDHDWGEWIISEEDSVRVCKNDENHIEKRDTATSIRNKTKDKKHGIILSKSVTSEPVTIIVKAPETAKITKIMIYDNLGNVVFDGGETWNLKNKSGRDVANGTYLIVAEATGVSGRVYRYQAKVGVKR